MARAGVVDRALDFRKSYTPQFVDKGAGIDLRPK
jgi:NitT/TauT family transport system substrate-binding protein